MDETTPKFKAIVAHYGPLNCDDAMYQGSPYNLFMEWNDGRHTTEPLDRVIQASLSLVVQYTVDNKLLNVVEWTSQLPEHVRSQFPRVLQPAASSSSDLCLDDINHCKAVAQALQKSFAVCESYADDHSCRTLRDGVYEIFVDVETMGSQFYEQVVKENEGLFRGCFSASRAPGSFSENPAEVLQKNTVVPVFDSKTNDCPTASTSTHTSTSTVVDDQSVKARAQTMHTADSDACTITNIPTKSRTEIDTTPTEELGVSSDSTTRAIITPTSETVKIMRATTSIAQQSIESLKAFATRTARQDPRVAEPGEFGNFSLLASRPKTAPQFRHIDTYRYEMQFGMTLTRSEGTVAYVVLDKLDTPQNIVELWIGLVGGKDKVDTTVTDNLLRAMLEDEVIVQWIQHYGKILGRPHRMIEVRTGESLPVGTMVSIPGGVVHGAPKNGQFRVCFFCTCTPAGITQRYSANTQFTGPTLTATIINCLWDHVDDAEQQFLLCVLYQCAMEDPSSDTVDFSSYLADDCIPEIGEILREVHELKAISPKKRLRRKKRRY